MAFISNTRSQSRVVSGEESQNINSGEIAELAIKRIVQSSWKDQVDDPEIAAILENHAYRMHMLFGKIDYEAFGVSNIITNMKYMTKGDLKNYVRTVELLAHFYKPKLGIELTSALMAGITSKARDVSSLKKYHSITTDKINIEIKYLETKLKLKSSELNKLNAKLQKNESNLLKRLLKKKDIKALKTKITTKMAKIEGFRNSIIKSKEKLKLFNTSPNQRA